MIWALTEPEVSCLDPKSAPSSKTFSGVATVTPLVVMSWHSILVLVGGCVFLVGGLSRRQTLRGCRAVMGCTLTFRLDSSVSCGGDEGIERS